MWSQQLTAFGKPLRSGLLAIPRKVMINLPNLSTMMEEKTPFVDDLLIGNGSGLPHC